MSELKKILIVEDEIITAKYYYKVLKELNFHIDISHNGQQALDLIKNTSYELIITDWLMPKINGFNLIKTIRNNFVNQPIILMITTLSSEMSKNLALESGSDEFLTKPVKSEQLKQTVKNLINRKQSNAEIIINAEKLLNNIPKPEFIAIAIATSTGGPPTLLKLFENTKFTLNASFFIVQHGPEWMFHTFKKRLQNLTQYKVKITENDLDIKPGHIYIAKGNYHTIIDKAKKFKLLDTPPINFVKPSADPLFQSIAETFGEFSLATILTGLGSDGTQGAFSIYKNGGEILIQNLNEAIAPSMPKSIINNQLPNIEKKLDEIPEYFDNFIKNKMNNSRKRK